MINGLMKSLEMPDKRILCYSTELVKTGQDFYDTLITSIRMPSALGTYITPPTAGEEQEIYVQKSAGTKELREVDEFKDYFGNNGKMADIWGYTLSALRFREKDLNKKYDIVNKVMAEVIITEIPDDIQMQIKDPKFTRDDFKDIINRMNRVAGTVVVPYCMGHVIREMHTTLGIFTEAEQTRCHKEHYALHGLLMGNLTIEKDPISDQYDVAVGRGGDWRHGEWCLRVDASYKRCYAGSFDGFRPVVRDSSS